MDLKVPPQHFVTPTGTYEHVPGVIGPFVLKGVYFENPLEYKDGKLGFNPDLKKYLRQKREHAQGVVLRNLDSRHRYYRKYPDAPSYEFITTGGIGIMCVAASKGGAVERFTDSIKNTYDLIA